MLFKTCLINIKNDTKKAIDIAESNCRVMCCTLSNCISASWYPTLLETLATPWNSVAQGTLEILLPVSWSNVASYGLTLSCCSSGNYGFQGNIFLLLLDNYSFSNWRRDTCESSFEKKSVQRNKKIPDKPGKLAQCIPIYATILGQCTRNRANAGPIFLVCRVVCNC